MGISWSSIPNPCVACLFDVDDEGSRGERDPPTKAVSPLRREDVGVAQRGPVAVLPSSPVIHGGRVIAPAAEEIVAPALPTPATAAPAAPAEEAPAQPLEAERQHESNVCSPERTPVPSEEPEERPEGVDTFFAAESSDAEALKADLQGMDSSASLAQLLSRVEELGNVNLALEVEQRRMYAVKDKNEEVRVKVMSQVMHVMGPGGPGLKVKKYHRTGGKGEKGKWAARVLRFSDFDGSSGDGRNVSITWASRRLFAKESPAVDIAEIHKIEASGKFVWITIEGSRLAFETRRSLDATLLCRCVEFLMEELYGSDMETSEDDAAHRVATRPAAISIKHRSDRGNTDASEELTPLPTPNAVQQQQQQTEQQTQPPKA